MKEEVDSSKKSSFEGKIIIFSAPSGSGKTTIVRHLLKTNPEYGFSISACTRKKRDYEVDGRDYYFLSADEFKTKIAENAFVEWQEVYENSFYGTLKSEVARVWSEQKHVLFDVDVKGGLNLKNYYQTNALAIFVKPPSLVILEERLRNRSTESEDSLQKRLAKAQFELSFASQFDVVLVNEKLEDTLQEAERIIQQFLRK